MTGMHNQIVEFDIYQRTHRVIAPEAFSAWKPNPNKLYWVHCDLNDKTHFATMSKKLGLPEDTIRLCQDKSHLSKLTELEHSLTLKFQCIKEKEFKKDREEHFDNLIMHLTDKYCFTASRSFLPALSEFQRDYTKALKFAKTPCFILFLIMDNVVNDYAQFLFNYEIMADQMDVKVRENHQNIHAEIVNIKNRTMEIKRCMVAIREILMRLSGRKITTVSDECRISLLNLFNQSQMIFHEIDSIRDMLNGLLSQIDYFLMKKLNVSMRVLTAFAAIFLPLTLITGIYGMNFHYIPELSWRYGYYGVLILILVVGFALLILFKKMEWF